MRLAGLDATHPRHVDIQHHQVKAMLLHRAHGFFAVPGLLHGKSARAQRRSKNSAQRRFIIHHQDTAIGDGLLSGSMGEVIFRSWYRQTERHVVLGRTPALQVQRATVG